MYQFQYTGPFSVQEGVNIDGLNYWRVGPTTNASGNISYAGHNDFVITWTINHTGTYPTTDADHYNSTVTGTYTFTENDIERIEILLLLLSLMGSMSQMRHLQ